MMRFHANVVALGMSACLATVGTQGRADPLPVNQCPLPPTKCFRITDIIYDPGDSGHVQIMFEVANWTDKTLGGLTIQLTNATSPGITVQAFSEASGRPIGLSRDNANFAPADGTSLPAGNKVGKSNRWPFLVLPSEKPGTLLGAGSMAVPNLSLPPGSHDPLVSPIDVSQDCPLVNNNTPAVKLAAANSACNKLSALGGCSFVTQFGSAMAVPEAVDNSVAPDNVLDGFVLDVSNLSAGSTLTFNWVLYDENRNPIMETDFGVNKPHPYSFGVFAMRRGTNAKAAYSQMQGLGRSDIFTPAGGSLAAADDLIAEIGANIVAPPLVASDTNVLSPAMGAAAAQLTTPNTQALIEKTHRVVCKDGPTSVSKTEDWCFVQDGLACPTVVGDPACECEASVNIPAATSCTTQLASVATAINAACAGSVSASASGSVLATTATGLHPCVAVNPPAPPAPATFNDVTKAKQQKDPNGMALAPGVPLLGGNWGLMAFGSALAGLGALLVWRRPEARKGARKA